ncbi:hypothetical protein NE237_031476 [Protea cynaroides]|uniref:Myb/SANT-like domain-containing protein n=1 Tax=Protea cynaroides TaxID=273540 RepID=A0A9Q0R2H6_9MAGN|nr:hypothetical protein NE237_031476 [Protea cynaroides]
MRCTESMDNALIDLLVEKAAKGNKCDKIFTGPAFTSVSRALTSQFGRDISAENMRNRLRTVKKKYMILKELVGQSSWRWNDDKQTLKVDDNVWKEYVQRH